MRNWSDILKDLEEPLDLSRVKTRKQGSEMVPYLEGDDVINTLNRIFGLDGWASEVPSSPQAVHLGNKVKTVNGKQEEVPQTLYTTSFTLRLYGIDPDETVRSITKTDIGKNTAEGSFSGMHEMAISGSATDALKRAARQLGAQFGITLYDKTSEDFLNISKPKTKNAPARKAAPKKATTKVSEDKNTSKNEEQSRNNMERAMSYIIPKKVGEVAVPYGGKTIKEAVGFSTAIPIIKWLAGLVEGPKASGLFNPSNEEEKKLQAATKYVVENVLEPAKK